MIQRRMDGRRETGADHCSRFSSRLTFLLATLVLATLVLAPAAMAQVPRGVSPRFARAIQRQDTTVVAWIIARPTADLAALEARVVARGGRVRMRSVFVRAISAELPASALRDVAAMSEVRRIQPVGAYFRRARELESQRGGGAALSLSRSPAALADTLYGANLWAVTQLRIQELHARGLRGAGARVAILDAGFNTLHPLMAGAIILAQRDFVNNDSVVRDQPGDPPGAMSHGTATWSLIAARAPGLLYGAAPDAQFLLAKTEVITSETRVEEDNWVAAVEWAVGLGAHIISSSLGYLSFDNGFSYAPGQLNGDIGVTTIAADSAAARGVLVVVSAGNSGPGGRTIDTPGDADLVISVGATDSLGRLVAFSSRGPTADGRIKPEVVAPGFNVTTAGTDSGVVIQNGTSFSAPLVAGIAALVQGARTGPAVGLRDGVIGAASSFFAPNNNAGYGTPDALKVFAFPVGVHGLAPDTQTLLTVTPTFLWDAGVPPASAGANVYFLRAWSDSALQHSLLDTVVTTTRLTMNRGLTAGTVLFWRVIAGSGFGVAESTSVFGPALVPSWSTLITLASPQGATIRDSLPRFVWRSPAAVTPPGPFSYDVDIYPASRTPAEAVASGRALTDTTFQPSTPLEKNLPFRWRVVAHLGADSQVVTSPGTFLVADASTPATTLLFQNFPNPFPNPATGLTRTCIWFDVAQPGDVRLEVFDIRGRLVRRLAPSAGVPAVLPAGRYGRPAGDAPGTCDDRFAWDGKDETGSFVRAGVYVYRLTAPGFQDSRRIVWQGP